MEVCTARCISNLPLIQPNLLPQNHIQSLHCKSHFPLNLNKLRFTSGLRYNCVKSSLRPNTSSEGTEKNEPDGVIIVEDTNKHSDVDDDDDDDDDKEQDYYTNPNNEAPQEEGSFVDNPLQLFKFLEGLNVKETEKVIKFDYENTYSILVFGGGGALALRLAAAVVGAIDSIPLFPKLLELIGLGYTVWFSSRYLIFKENREELFAKVEQIKQEVLGSNDD